SEVFARTDGYDQTNPCGGILRVSVGAGCKDHCGSVTDGAGNEGHDTGDRIIKELYKGITICTRLDDVCIRMGGEQFLILVPNQGLARTKEIGERIRTYVSKATDFPCTFKVSVGVAIYKGGDYHVTINLADKALRFAKENDVDMVVAYEDM
ncbi:MAG: GGDEF domain-containing protein, partial [Lachnospiraceae bacterium]|nr:GGDEF domain-containing protein [Lachnospiraceae bacterium]